ncbi:hypothetical protein C8Q77DRAFT_1158481 [Trametes polyzona]|nr:hypothetical protein C8Q77DRAFT_1158481 [Trametes polyzona]
MSDATNDAPLDTGSSPAPPPSSDGSDPDPGTLSPTDPNFTNGDPNSGLPVNAGPATPTDPNLSGSNPGSPNGITLGSAVNEPITTGTTEVSPLLPTTPVTVGSDPQGSSAPNALPDTGNSGNSSSLSLGSDSDKHTRTIIIASSVSGGVAIILALLVMIFVYRRRSNKRRNTVFVDAVPPPGRRGSDATWIGPKAGPSFDDDKLEAGNRNSDATMESETTTLADFMAARAKSGAFSTPSHTPRPSLDKIKTQVEPMVPTDPFERPRLSIVGKPRSSFDQAAVPSQQPMPLSRSRKSGAPTIRINSNSTFHSSVEIEQGDTLGPQSPGSPMVPLVTPVSPPPGWRPGAVEYIRAPTRRDSMVSLSRQSSRASSRNSQIIETAEPAKRTSKMAFSAVLAKKRRSRADSIDPFRKSSATMMSAASRRKSRAESIVSTRYNAYYAGAGGPRRKSRAESISQPTTPGGRRKARTASNPPLTPRQRSQATTTPYAGSPTQSIFTAPPEFVGLPRTPRTPIAVAAQRSRVPEQQSRTPAPRNPPTPSVPREPGTPGPREPRTLASARTPRTATMGPREPHTPRTPGGHPRTPAARVPRTPRSLDDAVAWSEVPLPPVPAEPRQPKSARAELRLSGLSRTLSEVSRESPM